MRRIAEPGAPSAVTLWQIDLDASPAEVDWLSPGERARADRFRFAIHRRRFIAARSALRLLVARELNSDPREIAFEYNAYGKPSVAGLEFNLAHSEHLALLALAPFPVGVDLEFRRPVEFDQLAENVFSPAELSAWRTMAPEEKPRAFHALWTRKEALLKGIGCGIGGHVRAVSVFFDNSASLSARGDWKVRSFELPGDFAAALAYQPAASTAT